MSNMNIDPKQIMIVRQSSLKFVIDYCRMIGSPMKMKEMVKMSENLTKYVFDGATKEVMDKMEKIDDYIASKWEE